MKCLICGQEFNKRVSLCNHIFRKHGMTKKEYYDAYIKQLDEGICKLDGCNNETTFINLEVGYKDCCCLEHTNLYRYGVKSNLNFEETKVKAQKNSHTKEANAKGLQTRIDRYGGSGFSSDSIKEKIIQTNLERYGTENPYSNSIVRNKCKKTKILKYGNENYNNRDKAKQTCLSRYGVEHQMRIDSTKDRIKSTCMSKYGVENCFQLESTKKSAHSTDAQHKRNIANRNRILSGKYKNSIEELFMTLCKKHNITVIPEYDSDVYPYACDFYIPDKDLYIELNIHWSHNNHWFSNNEEDLVILSSWKSKNNLYYNRAIDVWTVSDLKKRDIAKKNKLKYVVLWSKNEIIDWFSNGCNIRYDWQ